VQHRQADRQAQSGFRAIPARVTLFRMLEDAEAKEAWGAVIEIGEELLKREPLHLEGKDKLARDSHRERSEASAADRRKTRAC
jgi:hypothetical protein